MNANAVAALICPAMVAQEEEEEYMSQVSRWLEFQKQAERDLKSPECANFLKKMELGASDDEEDLEVEVSGEREKQFQVSHVKILYEEFTNYVDSVPPPNNHKKEAPAHWLGRKRPRKSNGGLFNGTLDQEGILRMEELCYKGLRI